jgi:preprotein translocase subunit YajC
MEIVSLFPSLPAMANGFGGGDGSFVSMILMMAVIFGIFYFLVIRPQQQRQSEHEELIENLESGDRVVTVGGVHGKITSVSEDVVQLNVAKDLKLTISRDKITRLQNGYSEE